MKLKKAVESIKGTKSLKSDLGQAKAEIRRLGLRVKRFEKMEDFQNRVISSIMDSVIALPIVRKGYFKPIKDDRLTYESVVGLVGDTHIGEVVSSEETRGLGVYNFNVFKKRYNYYIEKIIDFSQNKLKGYKFRKCHLMLLGDMVSGQIHEELMERRDLSIVDQAFLGAQVIALGIRQLASVFADVEVDCVYGGHGRVIKKKRYKERYVNWDYVMYKLIELMLKEQSNIKFRIPRAFFDLVDIEGHKFLIYHGDDIQSWMGIPYYGIERDVARWRELMYRTNEAFDYTILAHFHEKAEIGRFKIVNGTMKGADEFALGKLKKAAYAMQTIFGVHKKHGKTWTFDVMLDDIR